MATEMKRFTISVTPTMEVGLDAAKKKFFYNTTQSEMVRELLIRGLDVLMAENETTNIQKKKKHKDIRA